MRERFVDEVPASRWRRVLFEAYRWHVGALGRIVAEPVEEWVNGSFVTWKFEPNDIDFVAFVPIAAIDQMRAADRADLDELFMGPSTPRLHLLHAFLVATYPRGHPMKPLEEEARQYWLDAFGRDRETHAAKGVLLLHVGSADNDET